MIFFTIVIPTYNRAEKLNKTIISVLDQTYPNFEILVMDDGSTDHTKEVISNFSDDRIIYKWAPNSGGPATPRNRGINSAASPWICFLDADDIWYPTRLAETFNVIETKSNIDVICHNEMLNVIGSNKKTVLQYGPSSPDFYKTLLLEGNKLSTSAVTVRTDFLLKNKIKFNQKKEYIIVEDYDFWLRLAQSGAKFYFSIKVLGEYIVENDNISNSTQKLKQNLKVLLEDHVFNIQKFETDRNRLWKKVCFRLELQEGIDLLKEEDFFKGIYIISTKLLMHPILFLIEIYIRCKNKIYYQVNNYFQSF